MGISPKAVDPCRRNRIFMANSNTRASLSLNRCRHFISVGLAGCDDMAANGVCSAILEGRHHNSCGNKAMRIVPRVAGRVGSGIFHTNRRAGSSIIVARVNKAMKSVRSLPFLRTVHRVGDSVNHSGIVCVRYALIPCVGTTNRVGAGPARRDIGRLEDLNVRPGIVILHARVPVSRSVGSGVTLFYSVSGRTIVRTASTSALCSVPLSLRSRGLSRVIYGRLGLSYKRTSVAR